VDLTDPGLEFVVNEPGPVPGIIPSVTPTGFVEEYRGVAGINANPFSPASATVGEDRTVVGITIADGVLIAPPHQSFDALVFYREGGAAMVNQGALGDTAPIRNAVGGFHMALKDGEIPARGSARHPRSAAGLSEDGKTLYLLVVDGRRLGSIGATEEELGLILKRLGASDGLNFDGGGSSALALRYPDGKVRAANTPIHHGIPGRERAVATCLGIRLRAGEE
jgi:exopolysaccharide biosynthesis protein